MEDQKIEGPGKKKIFDYEDMEVLHVQKEERSLSKRSCAGDICPINNFCDVKVAEFFAFNDNFDGVDIPISEIFNMSIEKQPQKVENIRELKIVNGDYECTLIKVGMDRYSIKAALQNQDSYFMYAAICTKLLDLLPLGGEIVNDRSRDIELAQ